MQTNAAHSWGGETPDIRTWYGGLVDGMRDASGQMYMRNRYYDPATGQFTQTDPIGLAGRLNAYGFAAGDPVSYSDPYGLCPMCVAAVVALEVASTIYDVYDTYTSFRDGGLTEGSKALQAAILGAVVPGPVMGIATELMRYKLVCRQTGQQV